MVYILIPSVYYYLVDKNVHGDKGVGYSGHDTERGDISGNDGYGRRNIRCDNGDNRGGLNVYDARCGSRSKETIHTSSSNIGQTVGGDYRGGYLSYTSHYSPHNPGDHGRLLRVSIASCQIDDTIYENERGDSRGDDGRRGSRSQEIIHYYFHNYRESVYGDVISVYRSRSIPSPYHHSGGLGRSLGFSIHGHEKSVYRSLISQIYSYNHGGLYFFHSRSPQESIPRVVQIEKFKTNIKAVSYIHNKKPYYYYL